MRAMRALDLQTVLRRWIVHCVCLVNASLVAAQVAVQATPSGGATPRVTMSLSRSEAVLPTGKRENQWGPFEGRVTDAESGDAIAGAAVIVFWKTAILNPVEEHYEFYDARWAVSDAQGHFTVPRRDPPFITWGIGGAYLSCVAPGICRTSSPRNTTRRCRVPGSGKEPSCCQCTSGHR